MRAFYLLLGGLFFFESAKSQDTLLTSYDRHVVTGQFAGSTGFATVGYSYMMFQEKLEAGVYAGYVPPFAGRPQGTVSLKFTYVPFNFSFGKNVTLEPLTMGGFIVQHFGDDIPLFWEEQYPDGYYWWNRSLRYHVFIGRLVGLRSKSKYINKVKFYFEANTNDLYISSYFPNSEVLSLDDIFFLGCGLKAVISSGNKKR